MSNFRIWQEECTVLPSHNIHTHKVSFWDPPTLLSSGYRWDLSSGVRRLGRVADRLSPTTAGVKKGRAIPLLLHVSSLHSA
jgi:hypothetical protein